LVIPLSTELLEYALKLLEEGLSGNEMRKKFSLMSWRKKNHYNRLGFGIMAESYQLSNNFLSDNY